MRSILFRCSTLIGLCFRDEIFILSGELMKDLSLIIKVMKLNNICFFVRIIFFYNFELYFYDETI